MVVDLEPGCYITVTEFPVATLYGSQRVELSLDNPMQIRFANLTTPEQVDALIEALTEAKRGVFGDVVA